MGQRQTNVHYPFWGRCHFGSEILKTRGVHTIGGQRVGVWKTGVGNFFFSFISSTYLKNNHCWWLINIFFFHRFGLSQKLCVWKEILLKDLSYKNLDIHTIIFDVDIITAADHETKIRSALLICGKSRFFVRCCTNPLSLRSNEDWYGGTWIHWWFGQASSLMRYWIVGSAPIPKWFEMCWPVIEF